MKKVYIVNGSAAYEALFVSLGYAITHDSAKADIACFTGGADVSPELYGDKAHPYTQNWPKRDDQEMNFFNQFLNKKVPMVGICRGGQFLNVMSGGRMYQHVDKHTQAHEITDLQTGEVVYVSSTHHQMIMPSSDGLLVASSSLGGGREWFDGQIAKKDVSKEDIEVVYYEHTNALCFQPHPEFNAPNYEGMRKYFESLLKRFFKD